MPTHFWSIISERGGSMQENSERLSFGVAVDRAVAWLVVTLLAWLCYSTMALREQMAMMIAKSEARDAVIAQIQERVNKHLDEAKHGK